MSTSEPARLPEPLERLVLAAQQASPEVRLVIEPQALRGMITPLDVGDLRRFRDELQRGALDTAGARQS